MILTKERVEVFRAQADDNIQKSLAVSMMFSHDLCDLCASHEALRKRVEEMEASLSSHETRLADWLVSIGYPFDVPWEEPPPCIPMQLAEAWCRHDQDPDVYEDDYLNSFLAELGAEFMAKWTAQEALKGQDHE